MLAGLDYWHLLDIHIHESIEDFFTKYPKGTFFFSTTKGKKKYTDVKYEDGCFLVFGKETAGLPQKIHDTYSERCIKIPMIDDENARSLNLANSVAIMAYEALRQLDFPSMY